MDRQNSTVLAVDEALEHVVGKDSRAWEKWWAYFGQDREGIGIALYAALLSLGAPPHPEHLTQDLTDIQLSLLPNIRVATSDAAERDVLHRRYCRELNRLDQKYKRQRQYNMTLNRWIKKHGYVRFHKTQDPAQFRKLFAAFVLHACKGGSDGRDDAHLG